MRLIDADALEYDSINGGTDHFVWDGEIEAAPTILPAAGEWNSPAVETPVDEFFLAYLVLEWDGEKLYTYAALSKRSSWVESDKYEVEGHIYRLVKWAKINEEVE